MMSFVYVVQLFPSLIKIQKKVSLVFLEKALTCQCEKYVAVYIVGYLCVGRCDIAVESYKISPYPNLVLGFYELAEPVVTSCGGHSDLINAVNFVNIPLLIVGIIIMIMITMMNI